MGSEMCIRDRRKRQLSPRLRDSHARRDCRVGGVTIVFYVGEMCRYLVSAPEVANEKNHSLRLMVGNGMRADVWSRFLHRFGNVRIVEFYASTEGNVATINLTGDKIGSIGRIPFQISQAELVRYDIEEEEFIRDAMGYCVPLSLIHI